jgi:hypothetical protein
MVVTSLPRCRRGRADGDVGAARVGLAFQQPVEVGLQGSEAVQLAADLGQPPAQQVLGVPAGALAVVGDLEELADLPQPQPQAGTLRALDELQPGGPASPASSVGVLRGRGRAA